MNLISSTYQLLARKEFKLRDKRFEMFGRIRILWLHVMIILIEQPGKDETTRSKSCLFGTETMRLVVTIRRGLK